jgi:hypothetical protein
VTPTVTALTKYLPPDRVDDAVQLLEEAQLAKLELMACEARSITDAVSKRPIESDAEEVQASELMSRGVIALKELDALRRSKVDPLNAEVKATNALIATVADPLAALVGPLQRKHGEQGLLERLILTYKQVKAARLQREKAESDRKQREAAEKEQAALAKAEAAKTDKARQKALEEAEAASRAQAAAALEEPRAAPRGIKTDSGSVTTRKEWQAEVVNEALVPRQYLSVDLAKLRAAVKAGVREIPGCNVFEAEGLTRRVG